ncbi:MAG: L-serine ammonia-lyase, iron-sulfur-dependent, subunit alpha [Bacteroidota bacterium]|nr:L-serine ammonia-lyase, iron-sulfur-dependent, subunit alpha [Bacteroidota bacterium]
MSENEIEAIIALINQEVVPAIGCTEPVAVSLAVAKATEVLGQLPEKIDVFLSDNMLKNAMGVGIPGTGMVGLPIAIALGAIVGKSVYGLEVLKDLTPEALERGKQMVASGCLNIQQKGPNVDKLYIEAICTAKNDRSKVIICKDHTRIAYIERNGETLLKLPDQPIQEKTADEAPRLSFKTVCDFAFDTPLDKLRFILKSAELNKKVAIESKKGEYGHAIGLIGNSPIAQKVMGDSLFTRILSSTTAACDMRMAGAMIPVMCNSGSGNQGITATLPVTIYAEETRQSEESLIRALTLSHLMAIYIKQSLGKLSALCGAMIAGIGSSCGLTFLMGGSREQISYAIKNMIGNLTGIICDGAKPSCSIKVMSAVSTATISALMAIENKVITQLEGIIDDDVDQSIQNLTTIGAEGMKETDKLILKIMTDK